MHTLMQAVDPHTRDIDPSRFCPLRAVPVCIVQVFLELRVLSRVMVWLVAALQLSKVNG